MYIKGCPLPLVWSVVHSSLPRTFTYFPRPLKPKPTRPMMFKSLAATLLASLALQYASAVPLEGRQALATVYTSCTVPNKVALTFVSSDNHWPPFVTPAHPVFYRMTARTTT